MNALTTEQRELQAKKKFAEAWLKNPRDPFKAALICTHNNYAMALQIQSQWTHDPEVDALKRQLLADRGEEAFLPTRAEICEELWHRAQGTPDNDEHGKLIRLMADMRGMIEKPGVTVNNNVTTNKVMNVPVLINNTGTPVTDEEWEQKLIDQQNTLTAQ